MHSAICWHDEYCNTKNRILLTNDQLHIPGVRLFARHISYNATESLIWHYHDNAFEITMCSRGSFIFSTSEHDFPYSGGDIFVSFPNEIHSTNNLPITTGELYWLQLETNDENNFLFLKPEAARSMIAELNAIPHHVIHTNIKKTLPIIEKAFELAKNNKNHIFLATLIQLFLHMVIFYAQQEAPSISPDIQKVLNYITQNIFSALSLDDLAAIANLSCSHFKQKFKKQLGVSPRHFINQQKIEYSKSLLKSGKSVTETAMLMNFNTSTYFSAVFKKYTLYTPHEYQKMHERDFH